MVKVRMLLHLISAIVVGSAISGWASIASAQPARFAPDELLVGFRAGVSGAAADATYRRMGAAKVEELAQIKVHRIRVPARALEAVEKALSQRAEVRFVERNYSVPVQFIPTDPLLPNQWHHFVIKSPTAWDIAHGTPNIVVAIADTGVDVNHPDLGDRVVLPGFNATDKTADVTDVFGHGTIVAGTAAAAGNNGTGVAGVALGVGVMPVKVCLDHGTAITRRSPWESSGPQTAALG